MNALPFLPIPSRGAGFRLLVAALALADSEGAAGQFVDPRAERMVEPGCSADVLVSTGGPFPSSSGTLALRWTGYSNYELVFDEQVLLLDAYFDRGPGYPDLGFTAADVGRVDAIVIGHAHVDHMADAGPIAARTGAIVMGAPVTGDLLREQGLDAGQIRVVTGRGGERETFRGFVVEPVLARHGAPPPEVAGAFRDVLRSLAPPAPPTAEATEPARVRGSSDPRIAEEGTIAYLFTFDSGFRLLYRDSGGRVTDEERALAARVGPVDVLIAPTAASYLTSLIVAQAMEYIETYRPRVFLPAHHDAADSGLWRPTEPIFQAIADAYPEVVTISPRYREPICFDTSLTGR